ncbi:GGDEF domain-containing protein [Phosphitispora sp. TUW77]|uniref:GGDEF domain-containing protein n=1 Tax=Phosphitispora sp. TUW77 TaxID=3152361 RepID=UPI003AB13575
MERAKKHSTKLSIILLDIDDFKKANDTKGHLYGDAVIKELSKIIKNNIHANDYAGRYGGDEFLILLPATDVTGGENLYDRLSSSLQHNEFFHDKKVTISAGITIYNNESIDDVIRIADSRLYAAKRSGKANYISCRSIVENA